jgi:hypothetical protein
MPTRQRPEKALAALEEYRYKSVLRVDIEVVLDEDDASMQEPYVLRALKELDCHIFVDKHRSKVEACNSGAFSEWDILVLASDDMMPVRGGYDTVIAAKMLEHFPLYDGALAFHDGAQNALMTLPVLGRRLWEQFHGYVYEPVYSSFFCDTEQTELLRAMGRLVFIDRTIVEHRHPAHHKADEDFTYQKCRGDWHPDEAAYNERKKKVQPNSQFPFDAPPMWLTIGLPSLAMPSRLAEYLLNQIAHWAPRQAEIVLGSRQEVLDRAQGHYVAFIDEPDNVWVSHNYIRRIVTALRENPDVDCVAFVGAEEVNGKTERFEFSLANDARNLLRFYPPCHLNPTRIELAKAGEKPKTEVFLPGAIYYDLRST